MKTIIFEDHGQDFLEWDIDTEGVVIDSRPFQALVWCGRTVVVNTSVVAGEYLEVLIDGQERTINYAVKVVV